MKLEYLFLSDEDVKKLEDYNPEGVEKEVHPLDESECRIVTFTGKGENRNTANKLSDINEYVVELASPTVLRNDSSAYFNRKLYPLFNAFERKLRKLLYLKINLAKDEKAAETLSELEKKSFGELFDLLFTDSEFMKQVKTVINEKNVRFSKKQILEKMQEIAENTLWGSLLGNNMVPALCESFTDIRVLRNHVMHAHNIGKKVFQDAESLIVRINEQLDDEILNITHEPQDADENAKDFNARLTEALKREKAQRIDVNYTISGDNQTSFYDMIPMEVQQEAQRYAEQSRKRMLKQIQKLEMQYMQLLDEARYMRETNENEVPNDGKNEV